jgi:hypothetical protein
MNRIFIRAARSVALGRALVFAVAACTIGFVVETFASAAPVWQEAIYVLLGLALAYGAFAHVLCHLGYVTRRRDRAGPPKAEDLARGRATRFGALIPSYREEPEFVYRAMLSVALQRHDDKWLRLLVDDPPEPCGPEHKRLLEAARALPDQVRAFLEPFGRIAARASTTAAQGAEHAPGALVRAHRELAARFARLAREWPAETADDRFFRKQVLARLAADHAHDAAAVSADPVAARAEIAALRNRFSVRRGDFRAQALRQSHHAANKAMNLNAAIDLVGRRVREVRREGARLLEDSPSGILPLSRSGAPRHVGRRQPARA